MESDTLFSEIIGLTDELLNSNQDISLKVGGYSMFPNLRPGDLITIRQCCNEILQVGDIIVFKVGKKRIAHRIHEIRIVEEKRIFVTKGDSCKINDTPILEESIVGKVISFSRNKKVRNLKNFNRPYWSKRVFLGSTIMLKIIRIWIGFLFFKMKITKHLSGIYRNINFLTSTSKLSFRISLVFSLILGMLPLLIIYLVKWLIDKMSILNGLGPDNKEYFSLFYIISFIALAFLVQSVLSVFNRVVHEKLSQSVSNYVFGLLHQKYSSLDIEYLEDAEQQDKIHRATQEAGIRPNKIISQYLSLWQSIVSWLFITVLLFSIHWSVFFLILIAVIPGFFLRIKFSSELYRFSISISRKEREGFYYNRILTGLSFAKEVRLFGLKDFFTFRFETIQRDLQNKKNELLKGRILPDILSQIFAVLLIFFSFGFVTYLGINRVVSLGTVILFFLVFQRGYVVVRELFQSIASLIEDNVFLKEFIDFLNLPLIRKGCITALEEITITEGITIENVCFQYPSSKRNALYDVSLKIPKGKTVAIVGPNGSGKTTLIKLLCGFYVPQDGFIKFDDINIALLEPEILRKLITVVFQDFALYNLTAMENIFLGDVDKVLNEDDIRKAAINAGIGEMLENLPLSYYTMLGNLFEKGEDLSIGQWQEIAMAKAFYRDSPILLLDEPSSALDAETESIILKNLRKMANNKTVIIVSHRFSTIKWADLICVMEKGMVVEKGTHDELMTLKGRYFKMFNTASYS